MQIIRFCLLLVCLNFLIGCGQVSGNNSFKERFNNSVFVDIANSKISEVATPPIIRQISQDLEQYKPQLKIITPQAEQIFSQTDVSVEIKVEHLPVFQDQKLKLGNHLDFILDNQVSQLIYDLDQPIVLKNLSPGTHSLRVFASRPWGESYKNEGAYAQVTFSVLTETNDNRPVPDLPLLTYNSPSATYPSEPFLLDFYLTNAPLHTVAKNNPQLKDWLVKATVNGDSFLLEDWQPIYLTGFNKGENWIQLELIDEEGNNIENVFNNTVRVVNYDPQQTNTISKLFTNEISLAEAQLLTKQNFRTQQAETLEKNEPEIESAKKVEIENREDIVNPTPSKTRYPSIKDSNREEERVMDKNSDSLSKIISKSNTDKSTSNTNIPKSDQLKVNLPDENQQTTVTSPTENEPVQKSIVRSSSETTIVNPTISDESDSKVSKLDEQQVEIKSIENNTASPTKPKQIISIKSKDTNISEPLEKNSIPQLESNELEVDKIAIDIPTTDIFLDEAEETSAIGWWKKILVELRQKLEKLINYLPNKV